MKFVETLKWLSLPAAFALAVMVGLGCDKDEPKTQTTPSNPAPSKPATKPIIPIAQMADWCPEHSLPESICVQCNSSLAAGFKEKGDWCEEHSVPKSQDFAHHPELKEKFAADFKAKYGKEPPTGGQHEDPDHDDEKKAETE